MKYLTLFTISSLFYMGVYAQIENVATPQLKTGFKNNKLFPSGNTYMFQTGTQPFHPELIRPKIAIGYPAGTIGAGLSQQYRPNPTTFTFWNQRSMLPTQGFPEYPQFVLESASPVFSVTAPKGTIKSISAGQFNQGGFEPTYRKIKVVTGYPLQ